MGGPGCHEVGGYVRDGSSGQFLRCLMLFRSVRKEDVHWPRYTFAYSKQCRACGVRSSLECDWWNKQNEPVVQAASRAFRVVATVIQEDLARHAVNRTASGAILTLYQADRHRILSIGVAKLHAETQVVEALDAPEHWQLRHKPGARLREGISLLADELRETGQLLHIDDAIRTRLVW